MGTIKERLKALEAAAAIGKARMDPASILNMSDAELESVIAESLGQTIEYVHALTDHQLMALAQGQTHQGPIDGGEQWPR